MTEEKKKIKKMSNEEKVEVLAKFVALRSYNPRKAILYGYMLDCLLDEINRREKKIQKLQEEKEIHIKLEQQYKKEYLDVKEEAEKKDKMIRLLVEEYKNRHYNFCNKSEEEIIQYYENKAEKLSGISTIQEEK